MQNAAEKSGRQPEGAKLRELIVQVNSTRWEGPIWRMTLVD